MLAVILFTGLCKKFESADIETLTCACLLLGVCFCMTTIITKSKQWLLPMS